MRIISGQARGRKLKTLEGLDTRPTLDRTREALEKSVVRLCGIVSPEVPHEAMERAAQAMQLDDLQAFEKAFRKRAEQALPLTPQLAPAEQRASTENREFQI